MTKNIDIGEDTKLELSILAAKHGCNLKAFIEAQLNAMAETGKSFTEIQSELIGARNSLVANKTTANKRSAP